MPAAHPSRFAAALALFFLLACAGAGSPFRAVVVRSGGIDPQVDADVAARFAEQLGEIGFDVVIDPVPVEGDDLVAAARARARTAGAAHAVLLGFSSEAEREGVLAGTHLHAVRLTVQTVHQDPAHPAPTERMEFAFEDPSAAGVERRVADAWIDALAPWAVQQLYLTPDLAPALSGGDIAREDIAAASKLKETEPLVWLRQEHVNDFAGYCAKERERVAAFAAAEGVRCFGDPCGQYMLLGLDPAGRAIVQDVSRAPMYAIPPGPYNTWSEPPERIFAVSLDDPSVEHTLLRSPNLYGFGAFEPGASVGAVELFSSEGTGAIYAFDLADGARRALSLLGPDEETRFSRASPDGAGILACLRGGGCFYEAGAGRVPVRELTVAEWVALDGGPRIFGQLGSGELALIDPVAGEVRTAPVAGDVRGILGLHEGAVRVITRDRRGACALISVDPERMRIASTARMPACVDSAASLPDGRVTGIARATGPGDIPGDPEVVLWTPGGDALVPLTKGGFIEEDPAVTPDGGRVVFSRRLERPPKDFDLEVYRRVVCAVDVP